MKQKILCFGVFFMQFIAFAQVEDAWVYLIDKDNVATSIANPISILTQKAIDRKAKHDVAIDARDVPVTEAYITQLKNASGITVMAKSKWFNAVHIRGTKSDIDDLLLNSTFSFIDYIDFADKRLNAKHNFLTKTASVTKKFNLENTTATFEYGNAQNQIEMIHVDELHVDNKTGKNITIAVMDASFTNVNTMEAFKRLRDAGNLLGGYDFVDRTANVYAFNPTPASISHGTQVLSCMAGFIQGDYVGTAPDASYYLFRTEDTNDENPVEESYWVEAAERADSLGVDIISTSLGYKDYSPNYSNYSYTNNQLNGYTTYITKGANMAFEKGLLLVTSAGNSGNSGVGAPADSPHVLSIGAVDALGNYAYFSSVGSAIQPSQKPDVVAQGYLAYVIDVNDNIVQNNGTSFSGPIVAGGIACLMEALPNKTNAEIMQLVQESASQFISPDYKLGYGIPNLYQALHDLSVTSFNKKEFRIYPNPVNSSFTINVALKANKVPLKLYSTLGVLVFDSNIKSNSPINIEHLQKGVYIGVIQLETESQSFKLIKN